MNQPAAQPFIQVRDVSKYFGQFCALDAVSLDIELGQKLVICGPSGSGKSTLIRCINRLERHETGEIRIDGIVVDDSPTGRAVLRNNVGMVFQQFNLFPHLTILENLMLGPVRARKMAEADAWIVIAPEYNGSMPPTLNNVVAWMSTAMAWQDFRTLCTGKPVGLATHSGGGGAHVIMAMRQQFSFIGADVIGRTCMTSRDKEANPETIESMIDNLAR